MRKKKIFVAKELYTNRYKPRLVKPKKGKGSYTRKNSKA